jgi:hypothetical protein
MKQKLTGFHLDRENHWVTELDCGHAQHMRHEPPWMERPWVELECWMRSARSISPPRVA